MNLIDVYDPENPFALILQGVAPCSRVFEDEVALGFMDIFPQVNGHVLVIPKQARSTNFLDLPELEIGYFLIRVQRIAKAIVRALHPDGLELRQLNGSAAGQTVAHLHFHILPRITGIPIIPHGEARRANDVDLDSLAACIRGGFEK